MIEVRTATASIEVRGASLVASGTLVRLSTRWFTVAGAYRRPTHVRDAGGSSVRIRDHSMIARLAALILAMFLMKGMTR